MFVERDSGAGHVERRGDPVAEQLIVRGISLACQQVTKKPLTKCGVLAPFAWSPGELVAVQKRIQVLDFVVAYGLLGSASLRLLGSRGRPETCVERSCSVMARLPRLGIFTREGKSFPAG